jgi:O-antigen ligase
MIDYSMGAQPAVGTSGQREQHPNGLLNVALVLAVVTAIFHLYIGFVTYGIPLGVPLILIALVYLGGTGMIAANYRRGLWLKVGLAWVALVIILWALSAAVGAPNTRNLLAYLDKIVEVVLLGLLIWMRRSR